MQNALLSPEVTSRKDTQEPGVPSFFKRIEERVLRPEVLVRGVLYLTLLTYLPSVLFDYVYDDVALIQFNPWMESWKGIFTAFKHAFWAFTDFPRATDYYRPLVMTLFMTIRHTTGTAPGWFHLVAIAIHVTVVYLTYRVARILTGDVTVAALAAAIFGLHPTKIESVAWISGVSDSMCLMFFLGCMLLYLKWKEHGSEGRVSLWSVLLLLFAMLSKEMAVAVPMLIALYEFLSTQGGAGARLRTTIRVAGPYFLVAVAVLAWRSHVMKSVTPPRGIQNLFLYGMYTAPEAVFWYLGKQLWPTPISVQYSLLTVTKPSLLHFVLPLAALVIASGCLIWRVRKSAAACLLIAWFVLTLAPVLAYGSLLQLHDRHMYAPSVATSIGLAFVIVWLVKQARTRATVISMLAVLLAGLTLYQMQYWSDDVTLFRRAVTVGYNHSDAYQALAMSYFYFGEYGQMESVGKQWVENTKDHSGGWCTIATARLMQKDKLGARLAAEEALKSVRAAGSKVGPAYLLGQLAEDEGNWGDAEHWYNIAIAGEPNAAVLHYRYATALRNQGKSAESQRELQIYRKLREHQGI